MEANIIIHMLQVDTCTIQLHFLFANSVFTQYKILFVMGKVYFAHSCRNILP